MSIEYLNFSEEETLNLRKIDNTYSQYGCFYEAEIILYTLYCFDKCDINIQKEYVEVLLSAKKFLLALNFIENNNIKNHLLESKIYIANKMYNKANLYIKNISKNEKNSFLLNAVHKYLNINFINKKE